MIVEHQISVAPPTCDFIPFAAWCLIAQVVEPYAQAPTVLILMLDDDLLDSCLLAFHDIREAPGVGMFPFFFGDC